MSQKTQIRSGLENIQLAVTIAIAVLGGWLSYQQHQMKKTQAAMEVQQTAIANQLNEQRQQHDQRLAITVQSAKLLERAKDYLTELGLDDDKSHRVLISLLAIEKDIRMSLTGEINDQGVREQVNLLPLHLALLAGDSESLAHIGGGIRDLDRWLPIAKASGDIKVRQAAIDALKKIGELANDTVVIERCVEYIIMLTQRWNVAQLRTQGIDAIQRIAEVHAKSEIDDTDELNKKILTALREVQGAATPTETPSGEPPAGTPAEAIDVVQRAQGPEKAEQRDAIRQLVVQYQARATDAPLAETLSTLIEDLASNEATTRRLARSKISDQGAAAVAPLLNALKQAPSNYHLRVGVATTLMLMQQPLELKPDQIETIIPLLGDPDKTVRTNTAQFLGQLTNPEALRSTNEALTAKATNSQYYGNPTYIYNCVIVFVDWLKWNEYVKGSKVQIRQIKASLRTIDESLKKDSRVWTSTRKRIEEGLRMNPS